MDNIYINKKINPKGLKKGEYDAIIIGAGIGGLVCGCYLARTGRKILIIERNSKIGGYCSSFQRGGFLFDAACHQLGSCREGGHVGTLFSDLNLYKKIKLNRINPSDVVITPDFKARIMNDKDETIDQLSILFPKEKNNIKNFVNFIINSTFLKVFFKLRDLSFNDLLNSYFKDPHLKSLFKILAGCLYVPTFNLTAISASITLKESIFDGGYYPQGGMQAFSNAIGERFQEFGGELLVSSLVTKIVIKSKAVEGVIVNDALMTSKCVISNCDARLTFLDLIGKNYFVPKFIKTLNTLKTSAAFFGIYLGINKNLYNKFGKSATYWFTDIADIDNFFIQSQKKLILNGTYLICFSPSFCDKNLAPINCDSFCAITGAPFKNKHFWEKHCHKFAENLVNRLSKFANIPANSIIIKETATPFTFYERTLNSNGAFRGWASILSQNNIALVTTTTKIKGLFMTGHWLTQPEKGGIPMVVSSAKSTFNLIKNKI